MEKKKMKLWKIVFLIVVILLFLFILLTTRKMIILSSLNKKVMAYDNATNLHTKTDFSNNSTSQFSTIEHFFKDDVIKQVAVSKDKTRQLIQVTTPNERRNYTISGENKVLNIYHQDNSMVHLSRTSNFTGSTTLPECFLTAITSKVYTEELNQEPHYVLESSSSNNFVLAGDIQKVKAYINKETGLTTKLLAFAKQEDGTIQEFSISYYYDFNTVTDEDMKEPDRNEFKVIEATY